MQQLINPKGSAYRSETGGLMEALRVLSVEQSEFCGFELCYENADHRPYSSGLPQEILCSAQSLPDRNRQAF